jgi:hypothetical protein
LDQLDSLVEVVVDLVKVHNLMVLVVLVVVEMEVMIIHSQGEFMELVVVVDQLLVMAQMEVQVLSSYGIWRKLL